jgi:hypothetical protein
MLKIDDMRRRIVGRVASEGESEDAEKRFQAHLEQVRKAREEQDRMFDEAQEREKSRKDRLASLFDEATRKIEKEGPDVEPPQKFWD